MQDNIIYNLKNFLKGRPFLFECVRWFLGGSRVGLSPKEAIKGVSGKIVNLGSGSQRIRKDVINLDIHSYHNVDIVGDIYNLPFADNEVDAIICDQVLEHLNSPAKALFEMARALKPEGLIYIAAPFVAGYHSSPDDYQRWTTSGLGELLKDFTEKELGILVGPTNAMTYILREWLATALSFNSRFLYQFFLLFFMVLFIPLNWLDFILKHYKSASSIAHIYYFIGTK